MSTTKILAVDDEPDFEALITQRFRRQIRDQEFSFSFAHHGEEALRMLEADADIELMLLDINMPVMDGLTLLSHVHDRQFGVKAIIVSAYGDMTNLRTAMNRGAFDFVTKPVDFSDLEITIRKTLADIAKLREMDRLRAAAERARSNLSRYFSPNIVEMLAAQDEPLGAVRRQTVAVLFVDIVGFTRMAEAMEPEAVVTMLRDFHERMADIHVRWHGRKIHWRCDLRGLRCPNHQRQRCRQRAPVCRHDARGACPLEPPARNTG
jgi:adenylate cyclase